MNEPGGQENIPVKKQQGLKHFISELRQRNVFKVAVVYGITGWVIVQAVTAIFPAFEFPAWTTQFVIMLVLIGFPLVLIFAWVYELTSEGLKKTSEVEPAISIAPAVSKKLNTYIIGSLSLLVMFMLVERIFFAGSESSTPDLAAATIAPPTQPDTAPPAETTVQPAVLASSVAVLPFDNLSPDPDNAFFAAGIHEEILNHLVKLGRLNVISRTTMDTYANTSMTIPQIAQQLNVATIMEGSVRFADDRVLITVQLIDPRTDAHLWSESYEREFANIFAIQADIAMNVANALNAEFSQEEQARIEQVPTLNPRAYEFYLSGLDYAARAENDTAGWLLPAQQFQRAVDEDPDFALAWAWLSRTRTFSYWFSGRIDEESRNTAFEAAQRALELAPDLPEAHLALGQYHYHGFLDYEAALAEMAIAEQAMPGSVEVLDMQAAVYRRMGQWDQAIRLTERIAELDPRAASTFADHAQDFVIIGDYARAEYFLERALDIFPTLGQANDASARLPLWRDGDWASARSRAQLGGSFINMEQFYWLTALYARNYEAALTWLEQWRPEGALPELSEINKQVSRAQTYTLIGREELARAQYEDARPQAEAMLERYPGHEGVVLSLGSVMAGLGEIDAALLLGEQAMDMRSVAQDALTGKAIERDVILNILVPTGAYDMAIERLDTYFATPSLWKIEGLLPDPRLDPIRDDPRFVALVEKYRRKN